ncbi:MAG: aldehyde dehydrogenase (NADP(+)) [Actinomycetota bacterium]|nr:aldehyde dehydrogenase (NADP(+)) [Actinomycetota bacterium]
MTASPTSELGQVVSAIVAAASSAATIWSATSAAQRRTVLNAVADMLDAHADELVALAIAESHLTDGRLRGELKRTTFQLRLFGEVLEEGSFLDARIDHADPGWGMGPRPDLRRVLEPLGPVVVFAASNFPFAFSVAGGDTASALAAGCPVIVKAHFGHPELSALTGRLVVEAFSGAGAPNGLLTLIFGEDAGRQALTDRRVKAASFTGSITGGRALFDLANARPEPIPFFGEMGSINPVFVTAAAAQLRAEQIARGLIDSFTLGAGQFCTKPGVVFVPGKSVIIELLGQLTLPAAAPLLNDRIQHGYTAVLEGLAGHPAVEVLSQGSHAFGTPPTPTVLASTLEAVLADPRVLLSECFGPTVLAVKYRDEQDLLTAAQAVDGQLTATIVGEQSDRIVPELMRLLAGKAGRLLWNQWPTGVSVTYAQQHGGPYPATTSASSTSVGTGAISRFLRPVAYQGFPNALLPPALDDNNSLGISRRVDGTLIIGRTGSIGGSEQ